MFNGHLDIDPLAMNWKHDPWQPTVEGDRLYGAGVMNMKGGDAAMVMAAEAIRTSGLDLPGDVVVALVVGELQGGVGTVHLLETGLRTDAAIVPEPFGTDAVVTTHAAEAGGFRGADRPVTRAQRRPAPGRSPRNPPPRALESR